MKLIDLFAEMDKKQQSLKDQIKKEYFRVKELLGKQPSRMDLFTYMDDGITCGALLDGGKIGFRQLAPLTAEYRNLRVYQIK